MTGTPEEPFQNWNGPMGVPNKLDPQQPEADSDGEGVHLEAHASGQARIHQAGRDQHFHYGEGLHTRRRTVPGALAPECPYPGLAAFGRHQARWFFGRAGLIAELLARLDLRLNKGGIQAVVAPSGAGKSSLLQAGLLPKLAHAALPGSDRWPTLVFTPTADPIEALAAQLCTLTGTGTARMVEELTTDPQRCVTMLRQALREHTSAEDAPEPRILVVADQFEELFTQCTDERQQGMFIDLLTQLASSPADVATATRPVALVVAGLRADFYAVCVGYPQLRSALQDSPLLVGSMSQAELREAIVYPAQDVGLEIEPGLVELLLRDLGITADTGEAQAAGYEPGRLPLLAHALRTSWQQRHGATLTVEGYQITGGIHRAIATTADHVFAGLTADGQAMARTMFLRLIKIGDGTQDTRRRLSRSELVDASADPSTAAAVVDAFTAARLLTQHHDTIEITHEALLRGWPQLRSWIEADHGFLLVRQELSDDTAEWLRFGRDPAFLYSDTRLARALEAVDDGGLDDLAPAEKSFVEESRRRQKRRIRTVYQIIATLTVFLLVAVVATVAAINEASRTTEQRDIANKQRDGALSRHFADVAKSTPDPSLKAQLSLAAYRFADTPAARASLLSTLDSPTATSLAAHASSASDIWFRADRPLMLSSADDGVLRVWDTTNIKAPALLATLGGDDKPIWQAAVSPVSPIMVTVTSNLVVQLWDLSDPAHPVPGGTFNGRDRYINGVVISRDGRTMAYATTGRVAYVVDIRDIHRPKLLSSLKPWKFGFHGMSLSPDGKTLAIPSTRGLDLWDLTNPQRPKRWSKLEADDPLPSKVDLSDDGRSAIAYDGDTIQYLDLSRPTRPVRKVAKNVHDFNASAVSPNREIAALASTDGKLRLWDLADASHPKPLADFRGSGDALQSVAFTPDGRTLAAGSNDGTIRFWVLDQLVKPRPAARLGIPSAKLARTAIAPGRKLAATLDESGTLRIWDIARLSSPVLLATRKSGELRGLYRFEFAAEEQTLFMVDIYGELRTWQLTDSTRPEERLLFKGDKTLVSNTLMLSPDGRMVAFGTNLIVHVFEVRVSGPPAHRGSLETDNGYPYSVVEFTPNSRIVVGGTGGKPGTGTYGGGMSVLLWSLAKMPAQRQNSDIEVDQTATAIAFTRDSHIMAVATVDKIVRLFDIRNPARPTFLSDVEADVESVNGLTFSPDGRYLAAATGSRIHLWDVSDPLVPDSIDPLSVHSGHIQQVEFTPNSGAVMTATADGTVSAWQLDHHTAISQICSQVGGLTPEQWKRLIPDAAYRPQCW
ncbi:hypothetical protein [Nonomuraea sp. NPDC049625]|uniref:nSTAND1 domain-containing NTPase n=1 Tax=Nonomuraea sp. NPDC049625 TaxID=3155775 RepID=UPI00342EA694